MNWPVPRCFDEQTVAILASGPSMSQAMADDLHAAGLPAVAINSTFRLAPWAWMLYAADPEWWQHEANADARRFSGLKVSCSAVDGVHQLERTGHDGFDPRPGCVRTGGNSGYQALHIAAQTGATRILLCGFDLGGGHWHGPHPTGLRSTSPETYATWCMRFAKLAPILAGMGIDVVNCSADSALTCFRKAALADELERACAEH